jgi:16S rRNA (cytidine1402-2'-O)-methyltransferase
MSKKTLSDALSHLEGISAAGTAQINPGTPDSQKPLSHAKPVLLVPGLYIVATPIGNARDITLRALDVLAGCDVIAVEDTRVTSKLLSIYGVSKPLIPYNDHNAEQARPRLLGRLQKGERVALVSDAGTPLVSDPGYKLVRDVTEAGLKVIAIPGASAALAALTMAGLPTDRFLFAGFLPHKSGERRTALAELKDIPGTAIFFESPNRLADCLADMHAVLGDRAAVVTRELTKVYEELRRGDLKSLAETYANEPAPKGEITIVVGKAPEATPDYAKADKLLVDALAFMPVRAATDLVADALDLPRRALYDRALALKQAKEK